MTRDILKLVHYLLNFETRDVKLLQIVLTGQDELAEKVKRYQELRSRMIPIAINSMSPADLQNMLRFRWSVASGNTSQAPFTDDAFQEVFAYTKGLPRDAIKLADEVLRHLYISQQILWGPSIVGVDMLNAANNASRRNQCSPVSAVLPPSKPQLPNLI